jgi:nitrogen fixation-related uncharacterized protein
LNEVDKTSTVKNQAFDDLEGKGLNLLRDNLDDDSSSIESISSDDSDLIVVIH